MNRRDFISTIGALGVVIPYGAKASLIDTLPEPRIVLAPGALHNRHVLMCWEWCHERLKEGKIYARSHFFDQIVHLSDPKFEIVPGAPVWNWMTGDTKETGAGVFITEQGVPLGSVKVATNIGYEEYWGNPPKHPIPDYFVRSFWLGDESYKLEPFLKKGTIEFDYRFLERLRTV